MIHFTDGCNQPEGWDFLKKSGAVRIDVNRIERVTKTVHCAADDKLYT